jgi:S1-C subfamily serine protease
MEQLSETRPIGRFEKRAPDQLVNYESVTKPQKESVVAIRDGGLLLSLGTVMSEDGYIMTKASELNGAIDADVILATGKRFKAKEIASDPSFDLMLLKVEATDLKPVEFRRDDVVAGELAIVPDAKGRPSLPTVVSVESHAMEGARRAFLGIGPETTENGVRIVRIIPGGSAERNGLKVDDVILSVAGRDVHSRDELIDRIADFAPNDTVAIRYMRGDTIKTMDLALTGRFTNENPLLPLYNNPEMMGQFASTHAGGFPRAFQIDADVYPTKVGGPLLDLEGRAIGIVIARADRYPTFVIPAASVRTVFDQLKAGATSSGSP